MGKILKQNNKIKKRIVYQENYKKGVVADKEQILTILNMPDVVIYAVKAGKYNDGKEFLTVTFDNV
jgi:hypothetical protein